MLTTSNHNEVSVHCCHGRHTMTSSRTLFQSTYTIWKPAEIVSDLLNRPLLDRWMHSGFHAPKRTQMGTWLQLISQFQNVSRRSWLLLSRFPILLPLVWSTRVRLAGAACRIAVDARLSETIFFQSYLATFGLYPPSGMWKFYKRPRFGDWICLRPQADGSG
jgi:hypothetical protein